MMMTRFATTLLLSLHLASALPAQASDDALVGTWQGTLSVQGQELVVALHVELEDDGTYHATMDSITQGAEDIPVASVTRSGDDVILDVEAIGGRYEATIDTKGDKKLVGTWSQGGMNLPLVMEAVSQVAELTRPQNPVPPFPYRIEEVSFGHGDGDGRVTLSGTLTLPAEGTPHAAAVMITGSGPQDRDETVMGHKPFWIIADDLTRAGFAVLRFDDRGTGESTGSFPEATSADFADDVRAALRYLTTRDDIDADRLGVIGHSEGGLIAPMVATQGPEADLVSFAVLLAPPSVNIRDVILHQHRLIATADDQLDDPEFAISRKMMNDVFAIVLKHDDAEASTDEIRQFAEAAWKDLPEEMRQEDAATPEDIVQNALRMNAPWMRYLLAYDPVPALRAMRCQTLVLFGGRDLQVDPAQNRPPLDEAFAAGDVDATVIVLDGHNHLFQRTELGSPSEYAEIQETFSPRALEAVRTWLTDNIAR